MRFCELTLFNFKSFRGEHSIDFSEFGPGLYFLTGDNQDDKALGSNGAGKSTIWDALHWVLYGRTLRGLHATNVITWGEKTAKVQLTFEHNEDYFLLTRQQNPNSLTLITPTMERKHITNDELEEMLLGLRPTSFQNSVIMGQFNDMFFDMPAARKMELFTEALELESWNILANNASNLEKEMSRKCYEAESDVRTQEALRDQAQKQIDDVMRAFSDHGYDTKIKEIAYNIRSIAGELMDLEDDISEKEEDIAAFDRNREDASKRISELTAHVEAEEQRLNKYNMDVKECELKLSQLDQRRFQLSKIGQHCPTCMQEVDEFRIAEEVKKVELAYTDASMQLNRVRNAWSKQQSIVRTLRTERQKEQTIKANMETRARRVRKEVDNCRSEYYRKVKLRDSNIYEMKKLQDDKDHYERQIGDLRQHIEEANKRLSKAEQRRANSELYRNHYRYWAAGFKNVRLMIVEECLQQLELEVNNNLMELGMPGWEISFDVERETKAGTVSKGFQVMVRSPRSKEAVPFAAWSGGEGQRLRLVGNMGLANVINSRLGIETNIEVWDEPSAHLNQMDELLDTLYHRAQTYQRQIWLVDHRSTNFGGFAGIIQVVKNQNGSRLIRVR